MRDGRVRQSTVTVFGRRLAAVTAGRPEAVAFARRILRKYRLGRSGRGFPALYYLLRRHRRSGGQGPPWRVLYERWLLRDKVSFYEKAGVWAAGGKVSVRHAVYVPIQGREAGAISPGMLCGRTFSKVLTAGRRLPASKMLGTACPAGLPGRAFTSGQAADRPGPRDVFRRSAALGGGKRGATARSVFCGQGIYQSGGDRQYGRPVAAGSGPGRGPRLAGFTLRTIPAFELYASTSGTMVRGGRAAELAGPVGSKAGARQPMKYSPHSVGASGPAVPVASSGAGAAGRSLLPQWPEGDESFLKNGKGFLLHRTDQLQVTGFAALTQTGGKDSRPGAPVPLPEGSGVLRRLPVVGWQPAIAGYCLPLISRAGKGLSRKSLLQPGVLRLGRREEWGEDVRQETGAVRTDGFDRRSPEGGARRFKDRFGRGFLAGVVLPGADHRLVRTHGCLVTGGFGFDEDTRSAPPGRRGLRLSFRVPAGAAENLQVLRHLSTQPGVLAYPPVRLDTLRMAEVSSKKQTPSVAPVTGRREQPKSVEGGAVGGYEAFPGLLQPAVQLPAGADLNRLADQIYRLIERRIRIERERRGKPCW
ncbi:MAG: hypothetical protein AB1374_02435 [Bacillota bacterium]